jgi:hypothetical protein
MSTLEATQYILGNVTFSHVHYSEELEDYWFLWRGVPSRGYSNYEDAQGDLRRHMNHPENYPISVYAEA